MIVAGMHRSGTSMVAGVLGAAGVRMGRRMIAADDLNPRGYFEDADLVEFHGRVFEDLLPGGATGHVDWGWCEDAEPDWQRLAEFDAEASRLVRDREAEDEPWGFKDPRSTLLLDFWRRHVPAARFLLVYRAPWQVVGSILRSSFGAFLENPSWGYRVWMAYNRSLLRFLEQNPARCLLVNSSRVARDPERFAQLVQERFELAVDEAVLGGAIDPSLLAREIEDDPRARLVRAAYPACAELLDQLDERADLPARRSWHVPPEAQARSAQSPIDLSIVIPTHDDAVFLIESLASAVRTRPPRSEILIVNDGSRDAESLRVLDAMRELGYVVVDKPNGGLSSARNAGIRGSSGRYILPLDADNRLCSGFAQQAMDALETSPECGVVYGDRERFGAVRGVVVQPDFNLSRMLGGNEIDACAVFRRELWEDVGGYDTGMVGLEDWEFWLHAASRGWKFVHLPCVAFEYRVRPDSLLALSLSGKVRRQLMRHLLQKHGDLFHSGVPAWMRLLSTLSRSWLPASGHERLRRLEARLFWRPFWFLRGPGGLFARDRVERRAARKTMAQRGRRVALRGGGSHA